MNTDFEEFLSSARWFGGKGLSWSVTEVRRAGSLGSTALDGTPYVGIELVTVSYAEGGTETYQVPVAYYAEEQERLEHAAIGVWTDPELGTTVHAYDAVHDREVTILWLRAFDEGRRADGLVFHRLPGHDLDLDTHSTLFSGEQSNSSIAFGEDSLMKVFRKVTPGHNPDIEIHAALTEAGTPHVAALFGWLEAEAPGVAGTAAEPGDQSKDQPREHPGEPLQLAMLQQFLRTASDGWELALASVRDLFAEADLHAYEVGGDFGGESHRLGVATAEVHDSLAQSFPTATWESADLVRLAETFRGRLHRAAAAVPELEPYRAALTATFEAVASVHAEVQVQRVHGDFHLGQTLRTTRGWKIVDFEGEPAKTLAERVLADSPWRDVAGMLRSFDYAAHAVSADVEPGEGETQIAYRAAEWAARNQQEFLAGYVEACDRTTSGSLSEQQTVLLEAYTADKAVYETVYEARNRPSWIGIPLGAIARLTGSSAPDAPAGPADPSGSDTHQETS